jgi:ketosteroid isomerase-like protein
MAADPKGEVVNVRNDEALDGRAERDAVNIAVVNAFFTSFADGDLDRFASLWDDEGVLEFPFAPPELAPTVNRVLRGAQAIGDWARAVRPLGSEVAFTVESIRPLLEEDVLLVEVSEESTFVRGTSATAALIAIVTLRNGKLLHWREFSDPIPSLTAFQGDVAG